jgi:hypothetical protein
VQLWTATAQQIPQYFFLGKGYAISMEDWNNIQASGAFLNAGGAATMGGQDNPLAISSDFHNGPLSVIIPFGIWGVLAFWWILFVCGWILFRNYRNGSPSLKLANSFLLVQFLVKIFIFMTVFGALQNDLGTLMALVGLSVAINHGLARSNAAGTAAAIQRIQPGARLMRPRPAMARQFGNG